MNEQLRVRLKKLSWDSVREIENLNLRLGPKKNMVQVRNGYGKTTTLYLLRAIYTGILPENDHYPRYKRKFGGRREKSVFTAHLDIADVEDEMVPWDVSIVLIGIQDGVSTDIPQLSEADNLASQFFGFVQAWQENGYEKRDNGDNHQ